MQAQEDQLDILVIEDNPADFFIVADMLRSSTITSEGKVFLQRKKIGLVLLDLSHPDSFVFDSFLQIRALVQHIPVIILTGSTESAVALEALQQGAQDYLVKGDFKTDLLTRAIKYSVNRAELFNGTVKIISAPGKGSRLQIELKIKAVGSQKAA